ncbi:hypothetical protein HPT27_14725 [Permianibacter sp. IMCC34836]|uniref:hypothetical protein n=1 Tax=Permianibacter fluminis TaxID=2738515 RepID=UPI001557294A|nr:hypothetical protein [Permianibacter fluminis]NQD38279.1 hypothetical protein [Permianibacter fluminis]
MTTYRFHAFARLKNTEEFRVLGLDLSKSELKSKICKPYKAGKDIYISSTITRIADIQQLSIVRSQHNAKVELDRYGEEHAALIKKQNEGSGLIVLGVFRGNNPLELMECCENVTDTFIADAPGSGTFVTKTYAFFHNQWIIGIGLLIIGILIGKFLDAGT